MKLNILKFAHLARPRTHEGAPAEAITPEQALRRSVLACMLVPPRRGFALRDAMEASQPHVGTYLAHALNEVYAAADKNKAPYDRTLVITDEQTHDRIAAPRGRGYVINVASARNGVGYGPWVHIDGWSEAVLEYIREAERSAV